MRELKFNKMWGARNAYVLSGFSEYALAKRCGLDSRILLPGIIQAFAYPEDD